MLCVYFEVACPSLLLCYLLSACCCYSMLLTGFVGSTKDPVGHLLQEARSKFRNAQAQIALCKQEFFSAQRAGDYEKQAFCTSQIEYWQQKAVEEKQRAHKKIFSSKYVSNLKRIV